MYTTKVVLLTALQVRVFEHMVGYDPGDAQTGLAANRTLPANYTQFLTADGLRGARLGVVRSITDVSFADAEVMALYDGAISELEQQGTPCNVSRSDYIQTQALVCQHGRSQ